MKPSKPNIVLLHTDQQRADCLSLAGHPDLSTPVLDHLMASGARFTSAYSECPICIPARHVALTGLTPAHTGVVGFDTTARIQNPENTLPNLLRLGGYQTVHTGRGWHQYPHDKRYGFEQVSDQPHDEYYSRIQAIPYRSRLPGSMRNWPHYQDHALHPNGYTVRPWPYPEEFHQTCYAINKAIEFLDGRDKESPFFLSVGFVAPHPPFCPPKDILDKYLAMDLSHKIVRGAWASRPRNHGLGLFIGESKQVLEGRRRHETLAGYFASIEHVDNQLHALLHRLALEDGDTYVLFISDHGEMLGDHYFWRKSLPYEGSAHIPFSITGPGIPDGFQSDKPVGLQDLLPTCLSLARIDCPPVDGLDLSALWKNAGAETGQGGGAKAEETPWREYIHGEHCPMGGSHPGMHYLTDGKHKYIWFNDGSEQFFNLQNDPREECDLAADPGQSRVVSIWRERLVHELKSRPEGFVNDKGRLQGGRPYHTRTPWEAPTSPAYDPQHLQE